MKKSTLITGICYLAVGILCLILAIAFEWKIEGLLWGLAGGGIVPGVRMIWQYFHWTNPAHRAAYEKRLQAERIAMRDERNQMLRDRSGRIAHMIMIGVYCLSMLAFSFCSAMGWLMPFAKYAVIGLGILLVVQYACGAVAYQYLLKKH